MVRLDHDDREVAGAPEQSREDHDARRFDEQRCKRRRTILLDADDDLCDEHDHEQDSESLEQLRDVAQSFMRLEVLVAYACGARDLRLVAPVGDRNLPFRFHSCSPVAVTSGRDSRACPRG